MLTLIVVAVMIVTLKVLLYYVLVLASAIGIGFLAAVTYSLVRHYHQKPTS
jgi:hypothetical protein